MEFGGIINSTGTPSGLVLLASNKMTDLTKIHKAFKNSKVILDNAFWEKQNERSAENIERFQESDRRLSYKSKS